MTLAIQRFDRSVPLLDRTVPMPNIMAIFVPPGGPGVVGVLQGLFDAAEIPMARLAFVRDRGDPVVAVPVFPDRLFVHQYVYTRTDTGIESPADLRGRRVMVPGYFITASFWHRALLKEGYGILPSEIDWYTTIPELDERMAFPDGVKVTLVPSPYLGMERLLDGTVDCLMTEATLPLPASERSRIKRVYHDAHALQLDFYRRTGFHPIVHAIVVRKEALAAWPEFGVELCRAYDLAKAQIYQGLQNERMTSLPLMRAYLDETLELFGDDPWPYGLDRNRAEIDRFLEYAHADGFTQRRLAPEELFDARSLGYGFTARMAGGSEPWGGALPGAVV